MKTDKNYDVVLTYPAEKIRIFDTMIPLGLASIGAVLEENGFTVKMVDFSFYKGDFRRDLKRWSPKVLGTGGTTPTRSGSFLTARLAKEAIPDVTVVYGGPHASFTMEDTLTNVPQIDFIIKGEGEYSMLALCMKIINGQPIKKTEIAGLCYRKGQDIIINKSKRIECLDNLPVPARHLFESNYNIKLDYFGYEADFLVTSRGCPARCNFCSAARMFPGGVRCRTAGHIKRELDLILKHKNISALKIFDSTFTADRRHVEDFCNMIKSYGLMWECEIRADTVDFSLLKIMRDAGCCYVHVGLESASKQILKQIAKRITLRQVEQTLDWCRQLGIRTKVFFTFGHLGQTYESCKKDARYISRYKDKIDFYATTVGMRVYPGTGLEKQARRKQLIPDDFSWAKFKAPLRNLMLFEPGDMLILEQKSLSFFKLMLIIFFLIRQKTTISGEYVITLARRNTLSIFNFILARFRYLRHNIERKWIVLIGE